jgi:hypothetical protein
VLDTFREVIVADFEFAVTPGNWPRPVCLVAHELRSGRRSRIWQDQFGPAPPYATGPDVLFVAYYASAELGCYRVLGWPMPERILDLFTEFRARTNGLDTPADARSSASASQVGSRLKVFRGRGSRAVSSISVTIHSGTPLEHTRRLHHYENCGAPCQICA